MFQLWKQLALAGLIEGSYSGIAGSGNPWNAIDSNSPRSKMTNGMWAAFPRGDDAVGTTVLYATMANNQFIFGAVSSTGVPENPLLKPEEAWNIDTKLDDGKPGTGNITVRYWNNACGTGGATGADTANSVYNLSTTTAQCVLYFMRIF